jgi:CDP-paratose 2-epimerase
MRVLVTGAGGLIGSEASKHFLKDHLVWGIDNDMRSNFFGPEGSVIPTIERLKKEDSYTHFYADITSESQIENIFKSISPDVIVHCAAQPSHDKAADIPLLDFNVNAFGTINLLEAARKFCSKDSVFIHMSTNKVYGDGPNHLDIKEGDLRYDFKSQKYSKGISETFQIDQCLHSLFGASKVAADIIAQEYGRYFGMNVGVFRGGCLTGPQHAGVELHGFLSYIVKCALTDRPYTIFGYKGKQVRDQIHSYDVIQAFERFIENPRQGEVYNIGGGKENSASILEIIEYLKNRHNLSLSHTVSEKNRSGDHICYYTDLSKLKSHFPKWSITRSLDNIVDDIVFNSKIEKG